MLACIVIGYFIKTSIFGIGASFAVQILQTVPGFCRSLYTRLILLVFCCWPIKASLDLLCIQWHTHV